MNAATIAALCAALRSGTYRQARPGYLARGMRDGRPEEWETLGVLCDLQVAAGLIPPPTPLLTGGEVVWLYRDAPEGPPSCMSLPAKVLAAADMTWSAGDPFLVAGAYRTWTGHADERVTFAEFADGLEANPPEPIPKGALAA